MLQDGYTSLYFIFAPKVLALEKLSSVWRLCTLLSILKDNPPPSPMPVIDPSLRETFRMTNFYPDFFLSEYLTRHLAKNEIV